MVVSDHLLKRSILSMIHSLKFVFMLRELRDRRSSVSTFPLQLFNN